MTDDDLAEPLGPARRILRPASLVLVLSVAAVVVGALLVRRALVAPAASAWVAYAPLSHTTFTRSPSLDEVGGAALVAAGLTVLAFWLGTRVPHRSSTKRWRRILVVAFALAALVLGLVLVDWAERPFEGQVTLLLVEGVALAVVGLVALAFTAARSRA